MTDLIDLAGLWALRSVDGRHEAPMPLPGDGISALRDAGVIADPYVGMNEVSARWVSECDWIATRTVTLGEEARAEGWYLDITMLDTVAEIRINGEPVLSARNCFRRYRPDVSQALRVGDNDIEITFLSNVRAAAEAQAAQPFYIPYHQGNSPIPHGNMLRKPQCHFGWDWNLAVPPFGVYGTLLLRRYDIARIDHVRVYQDHQESGEIIIDVSIEITASRAATVPMAVSFDGEAFSSVPDCVLVAGKNTVGFSFYAEEAKEWWPHGHGEQHLCELTVAIDGMVESLRIGLRHIELITDRDATGARFAFRVNGRAIFCRGANWIPADALPSGATPEQIEILLTAARDANMNMIRVWGGGFYEQDAFYEICDRLGLLVWQDFQFACNLYPSMPDFLEEVREEVRYQVARLQHHACLALWCGDNEVIGALTWFEESRRDRDRYLVNYDRLNRAIEQTLRRADPWALWWPSSPSPGVLRFGDAWHDDRSGDMHFWDVWHEGKPFEAYRGVRPRFCSEFGFQSFPSLNVIRRFAQPEDCNISAPVMDAHQKNAGGNARITETLFRNFRFPKDFGNFVYLSQIQQGLAIRTAVDFWRSLKPHCMGTLYWQLNDTWPVASWSSLDYGGGWKALHYMARRFYQPVTLVAIPNDDKTRLALITVNDTPAPVKLTIVVTAVTVAGDRHPLATIEAGAPIERAREADAIDLTTVPADTLLHIAWQADNGMTGCFYYAPRPYKTYRLAPPALNLTVESAGDALIIAIETKRPALFVCLEADVPGWFSDNVLDLLPGEHAELRFTPRHAGDLDAARRTLVVRDLYSSSAVGH